MAVYDPSKTWAEMVEEDEMESEHFRQVSVCWGSYVRVEGDRIKLTSVFFANMWPNFWVHVAKHLKSSISWDMAEFLYRKDYMKYAMDDQWLEETARIISKSIGWETDFFKSFPWDWYSLSASALEAMCVRYKQYKAKKVSSWFLEASDSGEVSDKVREIERKFQEGFFSKNPSETRKLKISMLDIDEEGMSLADKYIINSLKLKHACYAPQEVPKYHLISIVDKAFSHLRSLKEMKGEDSVLHFRLMSEGYKNNQWAAIVRYKGFVGELLFAETYPDLRDSLPDEFQFGEGVELIPRDVDMIHTSEKDKISMKEIIENLRKTCGFEISMPPSVPLKFPDFYSYHKTDINMTVITIFECTWSSGTKTVKTINDQNKWSSFVKEFNNLNASAAVRTEFGFEKEVVMLHVVTVNVDEVSKRPHLKKSIQIRIDLVKSLLRRFRQGLMSHENASILRTIQASQMVKVDLCKPQEFVVDQKVLEELERQVDQEIFEDYNYSGYIKMLEKNITEEEMFTFENNLVNELKSKITPEYVMEQNKWKITNNKDIFRGIRHIEEAFFSKERIMRMVTNNHHDKHQLDHLTYGVNVNPIIDKTFSVFSDLLDCLNAKQTAKLKPTLCVMVFCSAGHSVYLTNNRQFGRTDSFEHKSSKISKILATLKPKFEDDPRYEALLSFKEKNQRGHKIWSDGKYSISQFRTTVEPHLLLLAKKKEDYDFNYRFTKSEKCVLVNSSNFPVVEKKCCENQRMRFEHSVNEEWVTCPDHKTRYRIVGPFDQLDAAINEFFKEKGVKTACCKDVTDFLLKLITTVGLNTILLSHIVHFLVGFCGEKVILNLLMNFFNLCHPILQDEIKFTLSKKTCSKHFKKACSSVIKDIEFVSIENEVLLSHSSNIIKRNFVENCKYLVDPISKHYLLQEFEALSRTNPQAVCLSSLAEDMIKSRSQYFCMSKALGYVTFSPIYGPIYSSQTSPDSESIRCFSASRGHFFVNHRTLRMVQGLPVLLVSNKLILDKLASRHCDPGDYSKDHLTRFCLLNSRRLNVDLQNIRYFFMTCWSNIHSPNVFKKLEFDFLKTSEMIVCLEILEYLKKVFLNRTFIHRFTDKSVDTLEPDEVNVFLDWVTKYPENEDFPLLFNDGVKVTLNNADLCLHSFYEVHLFEKTISGSVQEIRKVYEKFIKPKQAWFEDKLKFQNKVLSHNDASRFKMSDGLELDLKKSLERCFQDCENHENKYSGWNIMFVKCAARFYHHFTKDEFQTEIRMPSTISDLLKSTSTVKKFNPSVNFHQLCDAIELKDNVDKAMKALDKDLTEKLLGIVEIDDDGKSLFKKCMEKLNKIPRKTAKDVEPETCKKIIELSQKLDILDLSKDLIDQIDSELASSSFVQICENFENDKHSLRGKPEDQSQLADSYKVKFPECYKIFEESPDISLLLTLDNMKIPYEDMKRIIRQAYLSKTNSITTDNFHDALGLTVVSLYMKNWEKFSDKFFNSLNKERTPTNKRIKKVLAASLARFANPREMTTKLVCDVLALVKTETFADTYSIISQFKFNCDSIIFGMAFKEQFGGERELTIGDIWSKLTLKLVEDIARNVGRCMRNSCLNEPENEIEFKEKVVQKQSKNNYVYETSEIGFSSSYRYWSVDRSKWGPYHQGLAFYTVLNTLIRSRGDNKDVRDLIKYSLLKHAKKDFEIHHNVCRSTIYKMMRKGILLKENGLWKIDLNRSVRPDIVVKPWELFTVQILLSGKKSIHTRMDMGQGMLHSCSDVYGAVVDEYVNRIISRVLQEKFGVNYEYKSMNTSDDSSTYVQFQGVPRGINYDNLNVAQAVMTDVLQRMGNMYVSEKSVCSEEMNEFKSSFMVRGQEIRVIVKFLSTQLLIGKDCLPEDYWNSYNSLTKQILCNGGSQMMCDLLYLSKLHLMQSSYTFSKTCFKDCITDAPPSRFGFPNLTAVDIYYHTSKHLMAKRTVDFVQMCGFSNGVLEIIPDSSRKDNQSCTEFLQESRETLVVSEEDDLIKMTSKDNFKLPDSFVTSSGTAFCTGKSDPSETFFTKIKLRGAEKHLTLHHRERLGVHDLEKNLFKFYTLSRNPGFSDSETLCGGVDTVLPSQKGKKRDLEGVDIRSLRDLTVWEFFCMRYLPNSVESAKMRSAQALKQTYREEAKRAHQNMIFTKSLLINKGDFCFFKNESCKQEVAFNNFDCDDLDYHDISHLVISMADKYKPIFNMIHIPLRAQNEFTIEIRNTLSTHQSLKISLHDSPVYHTTNDPIIVRANMRVRSEVYSVEDAEILKYSKEFDTIVMDQDIKKFKTYYSHFTDEELMMICLGGKKTVLEGVYMFEQGHDMREQITLILQGCIHNHIQRSVTLPDDNFKEDLVDVVGIQKILLMTSIFSSHCTTKESMKSRLVNLFNRNPALNSALIEGMSERKYSRICCVIKKFIDSEDTTSESLLLDQYQFIKNLEESGSLMNKFWRGEVKGVYFKVTQNSDDQMVVKITLSPCNDETKTKVKDILMSNLSLTAETVEVVIDRELRSHSLYQMTENRRIMVDYKNHSFVLCLCSQMGVPDVNFFDESTNSDEKVLEKWRNCVEVCVNTPIVNEISTLWNLIKTDEDLGKIIMESDFSYYSLDDYQYQLQSLSEMMEIKPKTVSGLMAKVTSKPYHHSVVRSFFSANRAKFMNLNPPGLETRTSPFSHIFLLAKLILNAERIKDVFSVKNFVEVIPAHLRKIQEIPIIKYGGHQVTHMGLINNQGVTERAVGDYDFADKEGIKPAICMSQKEIIRQFGYNVNKTSLVFARETSINYLMKIKAEIPSVSVVIVDLDLSEVAVFNISNSGNIKALYDDDIIPNNPGFRLGLIVDNVDIETMNSTVLNLEF